MFYYAVLVLGLCGLWVFLNWSICKLLFNTMPSRRRTFYMVISHAIVLGIFTLLGMLLFFLDQYLGGIFDHHIYTKMIPCYIVFALVLEVYICHKNAP